MDKFIYLSACRLRVCLSIHVNLSINLTYSSQVDTVAVVEAGPLYDVETINPLAGVHSGDLGSVEPVEGIDNSIAQADTHGAAAAAAAPGYQPDVPLADTEVDYDVRLTDGAPYHANLTRSVLIRVFSVIFMGKASTLWYAFRSEYKRIQEAMKKFEPVEVGLQTFHFDGDSGEFEEDSNRVKWVGDTGATKYRSGADVVGDDAKQALIDAAKAEAASERHKRGLPEPRAPECEDYLILPSYFDVLSSAVSSFQIVGSQTITFYIYLLVFSTKGEGSIAHASSLVFNLQVMFLPFLPLLLFVLVCCNRLEYAAREMLFYYLLRNDIILAFHNPWRKWEIWIRVAKPGWKIWKLLPRPVTKTWWKPSSWWTPYSNYTAIHLLTIEWSVSIACVWLTAAYVVFVTTVMYEKLDYTLILFVIPQV